MKKLIFVLSLIIILSGCSSSYTTSNKHLWDMDNDTQQDTIYYDTEYLYVKYNKTGFIKKTPINFKSNKALLNFKDITGDSFPEIIALEEHNATVYNFKKIPIIINQGTNYTFTLKKLDNGGILVIAPNGQSFVAEGNFEGVFGVSKPFDFKTLDADSDGLYEIAFSYKITDNEKDILLLNCIEKYYNGFWYINEINYEILK